MGAFAPSGRWRFYWVLHLLVPLVAAAKRQTCPAIPPDEPQLFGYEVVAEFPHDPKAFTQGLVYDNKCDSSGNCREVLWESTGMYGESTVRVSHLDSGVVEKAVPMDRKWFGEGLALYQDKLYQVTWQGPQGFIYSVPDLKKVGEFQTPLKDGWGVAVDRELLVLSDGTSTLTWVDPEQGFKKIKSVEVKSGKRSIPYLNELEIIDGEVWANIWLTDCIARICPETGAVTGWVLMDGLRQNLQARNLPQPTRMDVLNGIAWDAVRQRLFVTGKYWPRIFEVAIQPINPNTTRNKEKAAACFGQGFNFL